MSPEEGAHDTDNIWNGPGVAFGIEVPEMGHLSGVVQVTGNRGFISTFSGRTFAIKAD